MPVQAAGQRSFAFSRRLTFLFALTAIYTIGLSALAVHVVLTPPTQSDGLWAIVFGLTLTWCLAPATAIAHEMSRHQANPVDSVWNRGLTFEIRNLPANGLRFSISARRCVSGRCTMKSDCDIPCVRLGRKQLLLCAMAMAVSTLPLSAQQQNSQYSPRFGMGHLL